MNVSRPIIKHLAGIIALVMVTGVALPVAAQACMMVMMDQPAAMVASCCPGSEDTQPCHGEPAHDHDEAPDHRHSEMMVCCATDAGVVFDEAVRNEAKESSVLGLLARATLQNERPVPPQAPLRGSPNLAQAGDGSGIGFHILYGVMLN